MIETKNIKNTNWQIHKLKKKNNFKLSARYSRIKFSIYLIIYEN